MIMCITGEKNKNEIVIGHFKEIEEIYGWSAMERYLSCMRNDI